MRNKKKKVLASILAISIFLQPVQTMTVSAIWPLGWKTQTTEKKRTYEEQWKMNNEMNLKMLKDLLESFPELKVRSLNELLAMVNAGRPNANEKKGGFLGSFWSGTKTFLFNLFLGYGSIFPAFLLMTVFNTVSQYWNNFKMRSELGNTGKLVSPMEARQDFLSLADGHKGQEEAKNKILNVGVYLAYSVLKGTKIRKLLFEVGPPGTGKTTLVEILALALGCGFFNVGASDVDPGSNKSVIDQVFGPRIKRMNNSEYFEDSPVMKFLRATEGNPLRIVAINEFDKLSEKDKKLLLEFLRNAYDNGYAYINGEKINLENVGWVLTSNDEDRTLFASPSLMSRFEVIKFAKLTFQNYIEILQTPFSQLVGEFAAGHNVHINFGNTIPEIAQKLTEGNTGARGVQAYVNTLTSKILNYVYSSEKIDKVKQGEPIFINILYDKDNDGFIIKEPNEVLIDAAKEVEQEPTETNDAIDEEIVQEPTETNDAADEEIVQETTETDDAVDEEVVEQETVKPDENIENSIRNLPDGEDNKVR